MRLGCPQFVAPFGKFDQILVQKIDTECVGELVVVQRPPGIAQRDYKRSEERCEPLSETSGWTKLCCFKLAALPTVCVFRHPIRSPQC
jgi:hypothetical protein